jgi:hypothetical protein
VGQSQQDAAEKCHPGTGTWLLERAEFREWIYAPNSFLWLYGICRLLTYIMMELLVIILSAGSGKTVLRSLLPPYISYLKRLTVPAM